MIIYFGDKNHRSKKKTKNKMLTTTFKSFDTIVITATTSSSFTSKGFGLLRIPKSSSITCALTIGNKVIYEIVMQKFNEYKNQYQKDQQTKKSFDELYGILQDN